MAHPVEKVHALHSVPSGLNEPASHAAHRSCVVRYSTQLPTGLFCLQGAAPLLKVPCAHSEHTPSTASKPAMHVTQYGLVGSHAVQFAGPAKQEDWFPPLYVFPLHAVHCLLSLS